jgi:Trk K+ transport system NAD-binding subunit
VTSSTIVGLRGRFQPIAPDRKLQPGDLLVAASRPGYLRRFSRELEFGS